MRQVTVKLEVEQIEWLQKVVWEHRVPMSRVVRYLLDEAMKNPAWFAEDPAVREEGE